MEGLFNLNNMSTGQIVIITCFSLIIFGSTIRALVIEAEHNSKWAMLHFMNVIICASIVMILIIYVQDENKHPKPVQYVQIQEPVYIKR